MEEASANANVSGVTVSADSDTASTGGENAFNCAVCQMPSSARCSNCLKVSYCSKEHQKQDWRRHKPDCFPAEIRSDLARGRHLVATRLIKQGEVFLKEKPLITGPSFRDGYQPICLSCCKVVRSSYKCSRCKWPVCDRDCEKASQHSGAECGIFAKAQLPPTPTTNAGPGGLPPLEYVKVLRGLLLRKYQPDKWQKLIQLEPHTERRGQDLRAVLQTASAIHFVKNNCELDEEFSPDTIQMVIGVIQINAMGSEDMPTLNPLKLFRSASYLFFNGSMATHSCSPNILRIVQLDSTLHFKALVPIKRGEHICTAYSDVLQGTMDRREYMERNYYFACACTRCADPTEFGTHFSSVTCQNCPHIFESNSDSDSEDSEPDRHTDSGFLLPVDPLNAQSEWKCNACSVVKPAADIRALVQQVKAEINAVLYDNTVGAMEQAEGVLRKWQGVFLHKHHSLMVAAEYDILQRIDYILKAGDVEPGLPSVALAERQVKLCWRSLLITAKIWLGDSHHRGRLLFFLQSGLANVVKHKMRTKLAVPMFSCIELKNLIDMVAQRRREGSAILRDFPPGRDEYLIGKFMEEDDDELEALRRNILM